MALPEFTMRQLLEAGVHFGHQSQRWNPRMAPYIYGARNGIHILDLTQTVPMLDQALDVIRETVAKGGRVLFVGTKRQAATPVAEAAEKSAQYYMNHRWLGGTLTNWKTVSQSIGRLQQIDEAMEGGAEGLTKKERLGMERDQIKLQASLGGIREMGDTPDLLFVIDVKKEALAVAEANKLGIPVVAVVDTNCSPDGIDFVIPGNDDAARAISLYCDLAARAALDGMSAQLGAAGVDLGAFEEAPVEELVVEEVVVEEAVAEAAPAEAAATEETTLSILRRADMAITASMVKELRDSTGAGMMDAKKALTETDGDMDAAVDWLRTKGLAKAAKKSGRTAAEGLVGVAVAGGKGVAVEVNSETDFVGKNAEFQEMVSGVAQLAMTADDLDALLASDMDGKTVQDVVTAKIATIGENMSVRRMASAEGEAVESYVHNAAAPGLGKIGVLVAYTGGNADFARQVAMHVAAANPASLSEADLDPAVVEKEKQVQIDIARESGKPDNVIEKMIVGRMKKWLGEVTLLGQAFVVNPDLTVEAAAKEAGVTITGYVRLEVGEGIEKKEEDFAAEVAKAAQG